MTTTEIEYRPGMTFGDFQTMMAQRRAAIAPVSIPLEVGDVCEHPFGDVRKVIRAKRVPGVERDQIRVLVEYECASCDTWLGHDRKQFRT